ncbi:MAG TPA: DeoR/GlpR family DNA-binding transcription regulator, partial [Phototrophicaceae bacterium]|nr:DeoR/GlpR family DNA-binding transcription regulator [Phototrophicaceae bacterium]
EKFGRVSVKTLTEQLNVSAVTIRQDLRALEDEGLLERTYGGAVMRTTSPLMPQVPELSFDNRRKKHHAEKQAIARAAAALVQDGYGIALDASTTAFALTPFLKRFDGLTIVTNSLMVAQQFLDSPRIQVVMPGGRLRRDSIALVGSPETLPDLNLNIGFFSARGLSLQAGMTDISPDEVAMKRALIAHCLATVVLIDSTKWGQVTAYTYVPAQDVERIITSDKAPRSQVDPFRQAGVRVDTITVP